MKHLFKLLSMAAIAFGIMGCGNYDYDVVVDHAEKLIGNYYTSSGSRWLLDSKEDKIIYPETYIAIEKEGMGIVISFFEGQQQEPKQGYKEQMQKALQTVHFTYNDLAAGMERYVVGNTPMRRYTLNKDGKKVTITMGTNNIYESSPKIVYESEIAIFRGTQSTVNPIESGEAYDVAYLRSGYGFFSDNAVVDSLIKTCGITRIVFRAKVTGEAGDNPIVSIERNNSKKAWITHDGEGTLYVNTDAAKFMANPDCSSMFEYLYYIEEIDFGKCFDSSNVTDMNYMFSNCQSLKKLDLSGFNTCNVTKMGCLFERCSLLTRLDLSNFDTSNVNNMSGMFINCEELELVDLSSFDTSNATLMDYMFAYCKKLESVDMSSFDTSNVTNINSMFSNCQELESVDLSSFNTSNVLDISSLFDNCESLTTITFGDKFILDSVEANYNVFYNCNSLTKVYYSNNATKERIQGFGFLGDEELWIKITK